METLPSSDRATIIDFARKKRKENTAEINNRQTAILNEEKQKAVNNYSKLLNDTDFLNTVTLTEINQVFGEPKNSYEINAKNQMVELATKIGEKEFNNVNNYKMNFDIQKKVLSGEVVDHFVKFMLDNETEPKSITDRVGDGISKSEFGLYKLFIT